MRLILVCLLTGVLCLSGCTPAKDIRDQVDSFSITASDEEQFPAMMFIAEPAIAKDGDSVTLRWSGSGEQCVASGGWQGSKTTSGVETTGALREDTVFLLSCSNGNRAGVQKVHVDVQAITPEVEFASAHDLVPVNGRTTLHWHAEGARICRASGGWQGELPTEGSWQTEALKRSTSYHLSCVSDAGTALTSISVGILPQSAVQS